MNTEHDRFLTEIFKRVAKCPECSKNFDNHSLKWSPMGQPLMECKS